jgi:short-subunit dehydrogenase
MNPSNARVLVTGATGGIGSAIVEELLRRGASVLMTGRNRATLAETTARLSARGRHLSAEAADLCSAADCTRLTRVAARAFGGINVLVNNAGLGSFGMFEALPDEDIERLVAANVTAPMLLTRALLPTLTLQPSASIINVGSVFGTIGHPGFAVYSATKFALRGFSEALRRELADTNVDVLHVAPRATRTRMNSAAADRLNSALGVATDLPAVVATAVCDALERVRNESVIGWPEKFYARVNAVLPRLVDRSLARSLPIVKSHAAAEQITQAPPSEPRKPLNLESTEVSS